MVTLTRTRPSAYKVRFTGGLLDGCRVRIDWADYRAGVLRMPGARGRYVEVDGQWCWEKDWSEAHA